VAAERVEGVREAEFAYPEGTGTITYDTTVTSDSVIMAEVERATEFDLTVREPETPEP
jgi:copper chaperone CopZ